MCWNLNAAHAYQARPVSLHFAVVLQPVLGVLEYLCSTRVFRLNNPIVHPFTLSSGTDNPSTAKVGKMPGNFWLRYSQDLDKVADADLILSHEIQELQACSICQSSEQQFHISCGWHATDLSTLNTFALTHVSMAQYIR